MRVGCLQFAPKLGEVDHNLNRADAILTKAKFDDPDLIVLPEMAFTGTNFGSEKDKVPFLEPSASGVTSLWARTAAIKYGCTVAAGYPESANWSTAQPASAEHDSSVIMVNAAGETIANHSCGTWGMREDGFSNTVLPGLGKASMGHGELKGPLSTGLFLISFLRRFRLTGKGLGKSEFLESEKTQAFARHLLHQHSRIAVIPMAWTTAERQRKFSCRPQEPEMDSLTCCVRRLEPLIRAEMEEETIVVLCNRAGSDGSATYAGTSAVIGIKGGEVLVYGLLGRCNKEILVVDTANGPIAKLVSPPDEEEDLGVEWDEESSDDVDESEAEPLTPETTTGQSLDPIVPSLQKSIVDEGTKQPEENAGLIAVARLPLTNAGPTIAVKRMATVRPKLVIPASVSNSLPPQEIKANRFLSQSVYRGRGNPAPSASTPCRNGTTPRERYETSGQMESGKTSKDYREVSTPITAFQDFTPVSAFFGWPTGENSQELPDMPLLPTTIALVRDPQVVPLQQNKVSTSRTTEQARRALSARPGTPQVPRHYFAWPRSHRPSVSRAERSHTCTSTIEVCADFKRPVSPKFRNAASATQLYGGKEECGAITTLVNPSMVARGSNPGRDLENRGRLRHGRTEYEEKGRSSSCDSIRNELLHRKVKGSDQSTVRIGRGKRSQSTSERLQGSSLERNEHPQLRNCRSQVLGSNANAMARRAGFNSWPISREELQRAASAIHESLVKHS
ncbi:hypothetical protein NLG97_g2347 [Lecanicillium saksenae]|uniref:Uncharacterized protein n=1 Tax=Lecanicillium saksenae TaxID=468837 RepID=A0ACC1R3V3_9HYPO|nr:hypothetical protein NLG97_g2347 [Lecanicillium saksenae]